MRNVAKAFFLTLLSYLLQVSLMYHLKIDGVVGNLLAVNIAVLTVSLGKKYAFGASCLSGILTEVMTASVGGLYAVLYPAISILLAQVFADMSYEKREKKRQRIEKRRKNNDVKDMNPHVRIVLNAIAVAAGIEIILLAYVTLSGAELSFRLIYRALLSIVYTGVLALVLMWPARAFLHMYGGRIKRATEETNQV